MRIYYQGFGLAAGLSLALAITSLTNADFLTGVALGFGCSMVGLLLGLAAGRG